MTEQEKLFLKTDNDCIFYLQKHQSIWNRHQVIARYVNDLVTEKGQIDAAWLQQEQNTTSGQTDNKHIQMTDLVSRTYKLTCKLSFFAKDTKNVTLYEKTSVSESWFRADGESELFRKCNTMVALGRQNLANARNYGVTEEELADIERHITTVSQLPSELAMTANERKAATQSIKQHIAKSREILSTLDDAFEGMIDDDAFLDGWFDVRKVKGRSRAKKVGDKQQNS